MECSHESKNNSSFTIQICGRSNKFTAKSKIQQIQVFKTMEVINWQATDTKLYTKLLIFIDTAFRFNAFRYNVIMPNMMGIHNKRFKIYF
jgi:hypothetical protein